MGQSWQKQSPTLHYQSAVQVKMAWREKTFFGIVRNMELSYQQFVYGDVKSLTKQTGCLKPCKYKKYRLIGDPQVLRFMGNNICWAQCHPIPQSMPLTGQPTKEFALQPISNDTLVCLNKNKTSQRRLTIHVPINSGGNGRADLPLAILFGRIWRSSWSLSRIFLHDHLGWDDGYDDISDGTEDEFPIN